MTINVTQDDIQNGNPFNAGLCPICLACHRILNLRKGEVYITEKRGLIITRKQYGEFDLPNKAQRLIYDLQKEKPVEPLEFEVDINYMDWYLKKELKSI